MPRADAPRDKEPPEGSPWDTPIAEAPLAFVDLEMTGLDPKVDRVIEVAVSRRRGAVVEDAFDSLVNPGPHAIFKTDVHGLGPLQLAEAPPFGDVARRILETCSGAVLVAHGAWWDVTFLEAEFARLGHDVRFHFYLDTVTLSRRALKADSHSLEALARRFAIDRGTAHRAKDDVRSLIALFERLLDELRPSSPRDLWHVRIAERHARPEIIERCIAFAGTGVPARILYRPSHKAPRAFEAILTLVRTDLDPPRVMGYSLPGRGRFDLRSDRILAITHTTETAEPAPP
ncbi:MAG TPA: 3'-5' exonuclease [Polyangiaceae bacterium]|jgi:DNA polymerase-3 subunit epsilon|nr:3'-5' exonuclease [Polyangiaceae bacterium]